MGKPSYAFGVTSIAKVAQLRSKMKGKQTVVVLVLSVNGKLHQFALELNLKASTIYNIL